MDVNIYAAWTAFLVGTLSGAVPGLFFHAESWLGGYSSWKRRMLRLGHISFFGIGILNLAFALTVRTMNLQGGLHLIAALFLIGIVAMPLVCYLSAWKKPFRHLFFIPASSVIAATTLFIWRILL